MASPAALGRVAYLGPVREAVPTLDLMHVSGADVVGVVAYDEGRATRRSSLALLTSRARVYGVPVLHPRAAMLPTALHWVRNLALDYLVCVGWSPLLTTEMVMVPRHGTLGLTKVLGPPGDRTAGVDWAIVRGDTLTGHPMAVLPPRAPRGAHGEGEEPANGTAVGGNGGTNGRRSGGTNGSQGWGAGRTNGGNGGDGHGPEGHAVYGEVARVGSELLAADLADLSVGAAAGAPAPSRVVDVHRAVLGLTSFDRRTEDVHRWIDAMGRPHSGAFADLRGQRVALWRAEPAGEYPTALPPGTILGPDGDGVVVTTRSGALRLLEVQRAGGVPEPASSWFERRNLPPGCAFDPVDARWLDWVLGPH